MFSLPKAIADHNGRHKQRATQIEVQKNYSVLTARLP
jgi:hypothetical protein